jgi:uncharacterized protein YjbJ (UPF0337 family)
MVTVAAALVRSYRAAGARDGKSVAAAPAPGSGAPPMAQDLPIRSVERLPELFSARTRNDTMAVNQQTLEGNWNEIKGKLHEKWGQVTKDELQKARGNVDQLVGVIQRKTGEARERIEDYLNELTSGGASAVSRVAETVRHYASHAAGSMEDVTGRAREAVRGGYVQTERMIQQRPMESLAVGFGAGLITGVVIGLLIRPH